MEKKQQKRDGKKSILDLKSIFHGGSHSMCSFGGTITKCDVESNVTGATIAKRFRQLLN